MQYYMFLLQGKAANLRLNILTSLTNRSEQR